MIEIVFKMLKSFFFFIISIFKRALCCFRRRKRANEFVPLTQVGVISDHNTVSTELNNWGDWNEPVTVPSKLNTVQEKIEYYRQQTIAARQVKEELPEVQENFFEDMAPTITKQTKVYINQNKAESQMSNKFSLAPENINRISQELEEWDDEKGWEAQTLDVEAREALKESRKHAIQKKIWEQQQRRQEKNTRGTLGAKVYS